MASQEMVSRQKTPPSAREETRSYGRVLSPAVDIFESDDMLTLVADMPGIDQDGLDINLEKGILTLSGKVHAESHGSPLVHEFSALNYYRQFKLSEHIDAEKANAKLADGVLTLQIPKAESAKPKKIQIRH